MKHQLAFAAFLAALAAAPAMAQQAQDQGAHHAVAAAEQPAALTEGEVRKVDKEAKKLTIRHGPIANLDMPAMTMVFQVQDVTILDSVKAGDKIRFQAEKAGGSYSVTRVEPAK
jgi:Cu(I)/Ag(I) efflux system periplasmic protein CusF